ncbi:MAG: 50S ribosomal protein L32 [Candidatus Omnitrophota bacterium]
MPNPKRRHSKTRRDKSRTHQKVAVPELNTCSQCGASKATHRVCLSCGYYNGEKILDVEKKQAKQQKKKEKK